MESIKLQSKNNAIKVELNDNGDFIVLSADSATFFDKYVSYFKELMQLADDTQSQVTELENKYNEEMSIEERMDLTIAISRTNIAFSEKATEMTDAFLGEGTVYKYFKELYDNVHDFTPDAECFLDFIDQINPVIEKVYGKKLEIRNNIRKEKTTKYQPQDFKRKAK